MDMRQFIQNRQKFPPDELAKYAGHYVAWSTDGKSILASGDDELALDRLLTAQGHDTSDILIAFVPLPDEVLLGRGRYGRMNRCRICPSRPRIRFPSLQGEYHSAYPAHGCRSG